MFRYYSDKRVVQGIKDGEQKIFDYLDSRFRKQIYKYVKQNSSSNPEEDGSDLYQDTMIEIIRVVREGRYREVWKFKGFFEKVYKRRWLTILEDRKKQPISDYEKLQLSAEVDITFRELSNIYADIDELLSEECKEIFKLEKRGYKLHEIAEKLGVPYNTIRKRKSRCIEKLRELME